MAANQLGALATLIRARRDELGLSLSEVARRADIDKGALLTSGGFDGRGRRR
jgi:hypothetical protein